LPDSYKNLTELLEAVSKTEEHNNMIMDSGIPYDLKTDSATDNTLSKLQNCTGAALTTDNKYSFHIKEHSYTFEELDYDIKRINITKINGNNSELIGYIPINSSALMIYGDYLITKGAAFYEEAETKEEFFNQRSECSYAIYDISNPEKPSLMHIFTQSGRTSECWMVGEKLYIVSGDGVCACGYGSDNPQKYYPFLKKDNEDINWDDGDITIVGKPGRVYYTALSIIDVTNGEIIEKEAMYGVGSNLFYGEDWIASSYTEPSGDGYSGNEFLYLFDGNFKFTGKINITKAANLDSKIKWDNKDKISGDSSSVVSVKRIENEYRIILESSHYENGWKASQSIIALSVYTDKDTSSRDRYEIVTEEGTISTFYNVTEILWEKDRAVIVTALTRYTDEIFDNTVASFVFADFNNGTVAVHGNELTADYPYSRFGESGNVYFGELNSLIPMGNGIYLKYAYHDNESPNGFDIFDFSDSASPKQLYKAEERITEKAGFDFFFHVYDNDTFGVLDVAYGKDTYFRNVTLRWTIYDIDVNNNQPFTKISQTEIDTAKFFNGVDIYDLTLFTVNDVLYYASQNGEISKPIN
ncbi:MAG: beta-propeller domain-containing protein, partial [Ruminiclostridium sp.]|nr:beta-propeller domain-containing protein [Ruminiclostridium sp.]